MLKADDIPGERGTAKGKGIGDGATEFLEFVPSVPGITQIRIDLERSIINGDEKVPTK